MSFCNSLAFTGQPRYGRRDTLPCAIEAPGCTGTPLSAHPDICESISCLKRKHPPSPPYTHTHTHTSRASIAVKPAPESLCV